VLPHPTHGRAPSFYDAIPTGDVDDTLRSYLSFLATRNGSVATEGAYPTREVWLAQSAAWDARHAGSVDVQAFQRGWAQRGVDRTVDPALLALLAFVKVNAGEAYGVETVRRHRHGSPAQGVFQTVERVLAHEETYHTRILLGATTQFDVPAPTGAWTPTLPLRVLIGTLAWSPKVLFHPVLLASEIAGVFTFNWMLKQVGTQFRDEPALRETLEARLLEILVDEIGHIAFNRLAVGPLGLAAARSLAPRVAAAASQMTPELGALGCDSAVGDFAHFDLSSLPEEARRRAFFV
jgi:hypothetical protein